MSVKEAAAEINFERGEKCDGTNPRDVQALKRHVLQQATREGGANEVLRSTVADQDKSFEDLQLNAATIALQKKRDIGVIGVAGVTAADGGITPEENDDLEKREKRNKEAVKRQEPDQRPGHTDTTTECWRVYKD
jgi:hypothetical protein